MNAPGGDVDRLLRRLAGRRALARFAILFERIWPALWPPLGVAGAFVCAALLDLPRLLPPWWHIGLLAVTAALILGLLIRGLRTIATPNDTAADRRLELASGLDHRPLAVLTDRPSRGIAGPDTASAALWQAHVARAVRSVRRLRVGLPRPGLARRDPHALRAALVIALVAALAIAGDDAPARLAQAMEPTLPREIPPPSTELQAWITPPAYTRLAPIFLKPDNGTVSVPAGARLTVSITGGSGTPILALDGHSEPFRTLDKASFQADRDLTVGGHLTVRRDGRELAAWNLAVIADQPPTAEWTDNPARAPGSQQTRLPWSASDDYGVVSLQAEMRLRDRPDAPPLVVSVPLPGGTPKSAHGVSQQDLTAHPWAGLPVIAELVARDALNQTGESREVEFVLPERPFQNPIARALMAIRRGLSLHPDDRASAANGLDALLMAPEALGGDYSAYVNLSAIYYLLERNKAPEAVGEAQQRMWELALHLEEGQTERTARALEEARQAARDALDKAIREPNEANREALDHKLKELEEAIARHLQAMVEEARRNNDEMPFDPEAQHLSNRDLDKMAEQAREAAREGRMEDAQQRMAELERMLDKLRNARAEHGRDGERTEAQRRRGRQQMGVVQDMIGRQGGLLDHSQGRVDEATRFRGNQPPTQPADEAAQREADRRVQQALRRALGELMQQFGDLTGQVPPSLGEAETAMREAGRQLDEANDAGAGESEQKAIEALQKGGREMGQAMAKQFGPQGGQNGSEEEGDSDGQMGLTLHDGQDDGPGHGWRSGPPGRADSGRDPLGRRYGQGSSGADESADVTVPEERERQRTQAIQEELRRRGGERLRPQMELDYIDRLLKQF
ncbi:MAG TPA: DUF4175 family protein [Acetobacteraceae bacterium]|nr:DUF4175 family protein [Acetobacteraceae bacterium]